MKQFLVSSIFFNLNYWLTFSQATAFFKVVTYLFGAVYYSFILSIKLRIFNISIDSSSINISFIFNAACITNNRKN